MSVERVAVETKVAAPVERAWKVYTTPEDIMKWNAASDDWHCPSAHVDLREGGEFSSRMEAKDGSKLMMKNNALWKTLTEHGTLKPGHN